MTTEAIILAGGQGTRLREAVPDLPKPLAPVAGRPFLAWMLDSLAAGGVRRVVLATGYLGGMIEAAIGPVHRGMAICYAREETPLGTGGAIRHALPHTTAEQVLVLNGDTYVRVPYAAMAVACAGADLAMAVHQVPDRSRYGAVVVEEDQVRGFLERGGDAAPGWINGGVYLIRRGAAFWPPGGAFSFERDVLQAGLAPIAAFPVPGPFIDIGTPDDYARAQTLLPQWHGAA